MICFKRVLLLLFLTQLLTKCKSERIFYYVTDLTDTNWKTYRMSFTTDEELIPSNYISWAIYSNRINETGSVVNQHLYTLIAYLCI